MRRLSQPIFIILLAVVLLAAWALFLPNQKPPATWDRPADVAGNYADNISLYETVQQTPAELNAMIGHAADCERAIIFVHAPWSIQSVIGLRAYDDFAVAYLDQPGVAFVNFHVMDYSLYNRAPDALKRLDGWQELADRGRAIFTGGGELIYLENGRVLEIEPVLGQHSRFTDRIQHAVDWTNQLVQGRGSR